MKFFVFCCALLKKSFLKNKIQAKDKRSSSWLCAEMELILFIWGSYQPHSFPLFRLWIVEQHVERSSVRRSIALQDLSTARRYHNGIPLTRRTLQFRAMKKSSKPVELCGSWLLFKCNWICLWCWPIPSLATTCSMRTRTMWSIAMPLRRRRRRISLESLTNIAGLHLPPSLQACADRTVKIFDTVKFIEHEWKRGGKDNGVYMILAIIHESQMKSTLQHARARTRTSQR